MPEGVKLYIEEERGPYKYKLSAYKSGILVGLFTGYRNLKARTVKCFPLAKIMPGVFETVVFVVGEEELEWASRRAAAK